jgi:hypothetical protein
LGGDADKGNNPQVIDDIWSLSNFERGKKLRALFGGNLPGNFPVISRFESATGQAVMIKSMDLTAPYYQTKENAIEKLENYLKELAAFEGATYGAVDIRKHQITSKQLTLVIPNNTLAPGVALALENSSRRAAALGITLVVERHGVKESALSAVGTPQPNKKSS